MMPLGERSPLLADAPHKITGTVQVARLITFASSFSEGWEGSIFALILVPVTREFGLTTNELVLLATAPMVMSLGGYLLIGWGMDMVGRKPMIMLSYVFCLLGCITMSMASNVIVLGAGRGVISLGIRSGIMCVTVYMSELSPAGSRGTLVSVEEFYYNVGTLFATFAAWGLMGMEIVTWRMFVAMSGFAPLVALVCMVALQVPESPRFLQMWGHRAEAAAILRDALGSNEEEIQRTLHLWMEDESDMAQKTWSQHFRQIAALAAHRGFRVAAFCWIARAGSGIIVIVTYFGLFMQDMGEEAILRWYAIGHLLKTLCLILPIWFLIDAFGRRALFLVSALACAVCIGTAAAFQLSGLPTVAVAACLVAYWMAFSLGYGPVVWVYCFEILPQQQRGRAATLSMLCGDVVSGVLMIAAPYLLEYHAALPYAVLSMTNILGAVFFFFACPETAGLVLEDASHIGNPPPSIVTKTVP